MELFAYYGVLNIILFGGLYVIAKLIEYAMQEYINQSTKEQK